MRERAFPLRDLRFGSVTALAAHELVVNNGSGGGVKSAWRWKPLATTNSPVVGATGNGTAASRRILVAVDDLFFLAKIRETARQLKVTIDMAKNDQELLEKAAPPPALIILDLNSTALKPISTIGKIRHTPELKKTPMIGFLSHLQAELKLKAQEAGCDLVMPRSAFSQNLTGLLRRHGLAETV